VANKTKKKSQTRDRRAKLEEMRRAQKAAERRRNLTFVVLAAVVGLGIIAAAVVPIINENRRTNKPLTDYGVSAAAAQCDAVTNDPVPSANHVGPGSGGDESVTRVQYSTVPPVGGDHFITPAPSTRHFYTAEDRPAMENLVHNLEHGYTIVWYDSTVTGDELKTLEDLSKRVPKDADRRKFIVSAWDDSYGSLPGGKHIALAHWSAQGEGVGSAGAGHRQLCGQVSGEVIDQFMTQFPFSDAPEPRAA
jgi:Protein of unknown function (DUF3105)